MTPRRGPLGTARTVLGDVAADHLGRINYHEHLFQSTPLLPGEELDDEALSRDEARSMRDSGIDAMIDATPYGLGRHPEAVARISRDVGVHVIATSGLHREAHYAGNADVLEFSADRMASRFLEDLTVGQLRADPSATTGSASRRRAIGPDGAPVCAGLLKAGLGYWSITSFESRVLEAVAIAHRATGAPVMIHLENGTCAHESLDALADGGVPEDRVVLAHIDRSPDPILYGELAERGAYLGCDGAARLKDWPESLLIDAIDRACHDGHSDRILLGGDVARRSRYLAYGGMPGIAYLTTRFAPRLASRVGDDTVREFLTDNPQRLLAWSDPAGQDAAALPRQENPNG